MPGRTKKPFSAFLPASACKQETYDRLEAVAQCEETSKADLIRIAVENFLSDLSQKSGYEFLKLEHTPITTKESR